MKVTKIEVQSVFQGLIAQESTTGKTIFIQREQDIDQFFQDCSFSALDEGYKKESEMNKQDAIDNVNLGWCVSFRFGLDLWQDYVEIFGND